MDKNKKHQNGPAKEDVKRSEDPEKLALGPDDDNQFTGMPDGKMPDFEPEQSGEGQMEQAEKSTDEK
ncbi:hypothetical protein [Bhargavaea cecembensis]|uniref:hypothetical protein n=1 Tax=Bhargavaea cecembensis TaxID=394098 RepID=UPI00058B3EA3|nr:hypothetical protein [Bhargavaea cecembensis]